MPKFKISDSSTGKSYVVTAPDLATAQQQYQAFTSASSAPAAPQTDAQGRQIIPDTSQYAGLPLPNTVSQAENAGQVKPFVNQHFGPSLADNPNPIPAIAAMGEGMASKIPIAGPYLQNWRDQANAGIYGGTPEQARADINETVKQNPIPNAIGQVAGATLPYVAASQVPLLNSALGFTGSLPARLGMTFGSQYAINTGDRLAHGDNIDTASKKGLIDAMVATPFAVLGQGPKEAGARAAAVATMEREGIPLTAGQQRGSKPLMTMESQLGGGATTAFQDKQLAALTKAALRRAGVNADAATPEVLQQAYTTIGNKFDSMAAMTHVRVDQPLQNDLIKAATDYQQLVGQPAPVVENFLNRVGTLAKQNGGILKGDNYKVLVTDLRNAVQNSGSNEVRAALNQMRTALDDAVERSMGGHTLGAWRQIRQQYKNLVNVTDAVGGTGELAAKGYITPASLRTAIASGDKRNYAKGYGDLNDLSHAANITIVRIPDSGTAGRLATMAAPTAVSAAFMHSGFPGALAAAGGVMAPPILGRAIVSAPGRAFIGRGGSAIPPALARGLTPQMIPAELQKALGISSSP